MAIANADGSIILSTRIDTTGISKGMRQIELLGKQTGQQINLNFMFAKNAIDKLAISLESVQAKLLLVLAVKKLTDFSNMSAKMATQTEASVQRLVDIYGSASDSVGDFIDQNARALGMSKSAAASFSSVYGNLFSVWADQATNAELTNRYLQMTAVIASKTSRTIEDTQERIRSGLLGNTEAIEDLGIFVNVKTIEMTDAFQRMADGKSWEQLDAYTQQQIRSMAILEQATAKYGDEVADTSTTIRNKYNAAYQDFQNSWGTIVNKVLIPVLQVLTQIFDIATRGINALSGRSGKILENAQIQEKETDKTAQNIEEQTKNQKNLNKEMKKTLAGFDDIQILSANTAENTNGENQPQGIGDLGEFSVDGSDVAKETSKTLEHIMRIVGAALVAVGVLLLMTKNPKIVAWGVAFIIAGASSFGISAAASIQEASDLGVGAVIATIMGMIGDALLALGVVLLFKGQTKFGIAFIIAGAALMAIEYFATTEFSTDPIANTLIKIMGIVGAALLALGIILCVFGVVNPISIGLIVAGAASLVGALVLNNDAVVDAIRGTFGIIMGILGGAALIIGIILTCAGILPLGIGLIIAGAGALGTTIAFNWNAIVDKVSAVGKAIANVFSKVWSGIVIGFKAMVNGIITFANLWVDGLNGLLMPLRGIIAGIAQAFGNKITLDNVKIPHIPKLAQGTVVPPNKEFMAILGDNTKEHEIVSPLSTIEQAVENVLSRNGGASREEHYYLNEQQLMSVLYKLTKGGEKLRGVSLEDGGY